MIWQLSLVNGLKLRAFHSAHLITRHLQNYLQKIREIDGISDFTLVSVIGKVHIRSEQSEVKVQERSVMKLDCNIADDTSAIKLTLWDKNIPLVQEGQVYEIVNARVRSYQGEKYL